MDELISTPIILHGASEYKKNLERNKSQTRDNNCLSCGYVHDHPRKDCWAFDKICHKCNQKGHISPVCKNKTENCVPMASVFCGNVESNAALCEVPPISVEMWNENDEYKGQMNVIPDSGAGANLMGAEQSQQIGAIDKGRSDKKLMAANKRPINVIGTMTAKMKYGDIKKDVKFVISDQHKGVLLNRQTCKDFGLLPEGWPHVSTQIETEESGGKHQNLCVRSRAAPDVFLGADHERSNDKKAAMMTTDTDGIFKEIMVDAFENDDKYYLAVTEMKSSFPMLYVFNDKPTPEMMTGALVSIFGTYGCPK